MIHHQRYKLHILLLILISITCLTYYHRYPTGDDAWFGEQSYWLEKEGIIRSEYFRGIVGWEKQLLVSHKLFLVVGAVFIHLFGSQLPVLQSVGLVFFLVLIAQIAFYIHSRKQLMPTLDLSLLGMLILIFSNRLLIKMSFENRPEMMLAALGFGTFLLLNHNKGRPWHVIAAAVLAGLAFLTHLNGSIYMIAGLSTLLYFRRYKDALLFSSIGGLVCSAYLLDILLAENGFALWWFQFKNDPATQTAMGIRPKLIQLLTYPGLFFRSPEQVAASLLLVYLLWYQRRRLSQLPTLLRVFSLSLFFSFWLITKANSGLYQLLFLPFILVLIAELYALRPLASTPFKVVLGIYFIIGLYGTIAIIYKNLSHEYVPDLYEKIGNRLPQDKVGVVPLTFFFNEYDDYPRLLTHENYKLFAKKKNMSARKFSEWSKNRGAQFIVMDYFFNRETFYPKPGTKRIPYFKLVFFNGRFAIYRRSSE